MVKDVWWDNVIFREFAAHFISMSDDQVVCDIRESVVKVINLDESGDSFGANMVRRAKERLCGRHDVAVQNGSKGGRPRKDTTADGDIREDSQAKPDGSAITRNETRAHDALEPSANHYGDTREHSRGRYAPPSCSPEDGNPAETAPSHGGSVASLEARQGQARESQRRAGADSVRGTPLHSAPARSRAKNSRCPNSREEFHAFVADNNLHEGLAEEWYAIHEARGWVDENGYTIKNWRGALKNYCIKTEQKRRTA